MLLFSSKAYYRLEIWHHPALMHLSPVRVNTLMVGGFVFSLEKKNLSHKSEHSYQNIFFFSDQHPLSGVHHHRHCSHCRGPGHFPGGTLLHALQTKPEKLETQRESFGFAWTLPSKLTFREHGFGCGSKGTNNKQGGVCL